MNNSTSYFKHSGFINELEFQQHHNNKKRISPNKIHFKIAYNPKYIFCFKYYFSLEIITRVSSIKYRKINLLYRIEELSQSVKNK